MNGLEVGELEGYGKLAIEASILGDRVPWDGFHSISRDIAMQIITDTEHRKPKVLRPNGRIVVGDRNRLTEEDPANGELN